jgi:hypothetical protein
MAQMYPNTLDINTESEAERRLYQAFKEVLDDQFVVFHSVAWQSLNEEKQPRDGEADFVIAHPKMGLLVMEVKGGGVRYEPQKGQWSSLDRNGDAHFIKNPFQQAKKSMYVLIDLIDRLMGGNRENRCIGYTIAFPDVLVDDAFLGPDRPREIILDQSDLLDVKKWTMNAFAYWRGQKRLRDALFGEVGIQSLINLLGKTRELHPVLWGEMMRESKQMIQLTEQQYIILDSLQTRRRAAISGCAGSGKTMLAAEKATRLARQGFRVLLTCYNKNLAIDLRERLPKLPNLQISNFHLLCYSLCVKVDNLPPFSHKDDYWNRQIVDSMVDAAAKLDIHFDAIVVDEGQDFLDNWWTALQLLLEDPENGLIYVFYDDNQRLFKKSGEFPIQDPPYPLSINCRNTKYIHQLVVRYYQGESIPTVFGPRGRKAEVIQFPSYNDFHDTLQAVLRRLTTEEKIPFDEITVLSPRVYESQLHNEFNRDEIALTDQWPPPPGKIHRSTIQAFKGLERSVIIVTELDTWCGVGIPLDRYIYVACSRARNHLIFLLSETSHSLREELISTIQNPKKVRRGK